MREYGQIQCGFWQAEEIVGLSDDGKLLATYLLTGPHSNGCGCYVCPDGYVIGDLRWSPERVSKGFEELSANRFAYRFGTVVFIRKFLAWNPVANGNVAIARMKEFHALPKGDAKGLLAGAILRFCKHISAADQSTLKTVGGTVSETLYETVWQTRSDPIRSDPDPTRPESGNALPEGLNQKAWSDWSAWRAASKHGPIEPDQVDATQRMLVAFGTDQQAAVDQAIAGGWKNLLAVKRVNGEASPEAIAAWDQMLKQQGAGTDPKIRKALDAIGGYQRVRTMSVVEKHIVRRQFLRAFAEAA